MKVYLSKSNASDPDVCSYVRKKLLSLGVEVIEFHGGAYKPESVLQGDYLLIVPPSKTLGSRKLSRGVKMWDYYGDDAFSTYSVGRGQHDQIEVFTDTKGNNAVLILLELEVQENGDINVEVDNLDSMDSIQADAHERYADLEYAGDQQELHDALGIDPDEIVLTKSISTSGKVMLAAAALYKIKL